MISGYLFGFPFHNTVNPYCSYRSRSRYLLFNRCYYSLLIMCRYYLYGLYN